jgi:Domain of unknown function (DUF4258)
MSESMDILRRGRQSAGKKMLFLPHAVRQMAKPDRMITTADIRMVIEAVEIIEDYPDDMRGPSRLMLGFAELIFPAIRNGKAVIEKGKNHEVYALPRTNEEGNGTISYRSKGLPSDFGCGAGLGLPTMRRGLF